MPSYNKVMIMGHLTRDPDLKSLPSGTSVCEFGVAINESYTDKDGQKQERACFVEVEAWARQSEVIAEHLTKGSPIFIEGALKYESWENEDGDKRSRLKIRLIRFTFIGSRQNGEGAAPSNTSNNNNKKNEVIEDNDIPF